MSELSTPAGSGVPARSATNAALKETRYFDVDEPALCWSYDLDELDLQGTTVGRSAHATKDPGQRR
jgi:hypothetical protein